ncbi:hypothetical protein GUJ93_ZPchr0013g34399 [Zizania palustris]|uniref:Transferrin receptor-like dimerisation domain-containing protein n=1 Tax=Zizania palustris TaxID=103762 RepID=A0A8J5WZ78_ZIZPA|nr:hypothetical protein GUJ93_ZPchr0013g34399 [Zizania palustris]
MPQVSAALGRMPLPPTSVRVLIGFGLLLLVSLLVLHRRPARLMVEGSRLDPAERFLSLFEGANATIAADLRALTAGPHLAGTPAAAGAAAHVLTRLRALGLRTLTREYAPLLSYPGHASLALLRADQTLIAQLSLDEPADAGRHLVRPYHAYAPSGGAVAEAVFVNLGREEDYLALDRLGVSVRGCIVVAIRGGGYRGGVVQRAAGRGAVAVLIAGHADGGVERGTVILGGPGILSLPAGRPRARRKRLGFDHETVMRRFPTIPSMPVSAMTASAILRSLGGPPLPAEWRIGVELAENFRGVGPGPIQEDCHDTGYFAIVKGYEEPDRYVILGNHRDAWTYGAVDPNSGTSALLDIARRLGIMLQSAGHLGGPSFFVAGMGEEFGMVKDPDVAGKTVHDTWNTMNGGINCAEFPVYHTALDSYNWMEMHGDPLFLRHVAIAEIWGLLALRLADDPVLPFDYQTYASQLQEHTNALSTMMKNSESVNLMNRCVDDLSGAAIEVLKEAKGVDTSDGYALMRRRLLNDRLLLAERSFLQPDGLQGRVWFKHLLYSPPEDYESKLAFFPGVADAISRSTNRSAKERRAAVRHEIWKISRAIQKAASVLRGEFSYRNESLNFSVSVAP